MKKFLITNRDGAYWVIEADNKYDAEKRWSRLTKYKQGRINLVREAA